MDSDNYCSGMRMRRGTNMKEEKFVMRFPSASDAFYSLTCNQNDILYVKLTVLFLQCGCGSLDYDCHVTTEAPCMQSNPLCSPRIY